VPTLAETFPGYEAVAFTGVGVPQGTPPEVIAQLNREINAGLADPGLRKRLDDLQNPYHSGHRLIYQDQLFLFERSRLSRVRICESPFPARAGKFVTLYPKVTCARAGAPPDSRQRQKIVRLIGEIRRADCPEGG
jgi:hypothetical protein